MDSNNINGEQKCQDCLYVELKNVQTIASVSYGTSESKKYSGSDMIKQNYSKQSACHRNKNKSSMELDVFETPKESMVTPYCSRTVDHITEASKKRSRKYVIIGSDNFVKCTPSLREESSWKDKMSASIVEHKLEKKLEDLNRKCDKYELEPACVDGFIVSCVEENKDKSCMEGSDVYSKPVRTSFDMNLTTPNVLMIPKTTNLDKGVLSKTSIRSLDLVTVSTRKSRTPPNTTKCNGESHSNVTVSSAVELVHPDTVGDSDHPGQLCRLCALPRQAMVYIFSETGLRLGLHSKINTWLPTHVSRTDPLPKQVCDICIEKLDLCQSFGTSCMKAEQKLNQLFENRKFRCHFQLHGEPDTTSYKNATASIKRSVDQSLTSKFNQILGGNVARDEQNCFISKPNMKSVLLSPTKTTNQHGSKMNLIKLENLSSDDEESNYLISEDSSTLELVDMILGDDCDEGNKKIAFQTKYCCPLCCEGRMVTVTQTIRDTCSSKRSHTEEVNTETDTERRDQMNIKKHSDISDNSSAEMFTCSNVQFIRGDHISHGVDLMEQDRDSNSFTWGLTKAENEDDNLEGTIGRGDRDSEGVVVINTKQGNVDVKSEKTEDDNPVNCLMCGGALINLSQCLIHTLCTHANSETNFYPCSLCEMCFSTDTDLTRHFMNIHQNIKDARLLHVCIVCGRRCASQRALKSHVCIPVNSVADELACKTCGKSFSTKARLVFHRQFHDPDARCLECIPCGMVFTEEDNLYDHVRFTHQGQSFICNECGGHFNSKAALRSHLRSHRNLRYHKCEVCNKTFLDKQTLKEHSVSHMEVKPFQCHICGKHLNRNSRLKKHLMSHELQKTTEPQECYKCTVCGETFPDESKAIVHAQIGHSLPSDSECVFQLYPIEKVYRCEFCERCYADPAALNSHRSSHTNEPHPFKCHICGAGFATFARVATHKVTHGIYEKKDDFSIPKLYLCNSCDKAYVHWTYLSVHRKMIHAEVKHVYKCKMCPEEFVNSWSLAYHRKTRHCETEPPPTDSGLPANERKRWKCEYCEKRYVTQQSLLVHVNVLHTGDSPGPTFQCDQCGKRFMRKLSLESHKRIHSGTKSHVCPLCKKTFVHSSGLSTHLRLHRGDRPYACEYCGKTFLQRGDRNDHVRKHTGERPFSCQHCPKSFRTRAMWFEHTRIHRNERPFPCDICGSSFRRSYALKNHKTIHTGERPHVCQICNKAFRQKQDMQKHVRNHHLE